jgi:hypothetical protein
MYSSDTGMSWERLPITGIQLSSDPAVDYSIPSDAMVTAVRVIGDTLWVGTEEGAAKIALADLQGGPLWGIYRVYDPSKELYVYPNPFSYVYDNDINFHYPIFNDAYVTISIYDFAMDLVHTPIDNRFTIAGEDSSATDSWNGRRGHYNSGTDQINFDADDVLAVGMYYYKISMSTGEVYWGRLAIEP